MQKLFYCTLFIFLSLRVDAQRIRFTDTTNQWKFVDGIIGPPPTEVYYKQQYGGGKIIDSVTYNKLDNVYIKEDTSVHKVFVRINDSTEEILMDYNLNVGDTVMHFSSHSSLIPYDSFWHVVTQIDSTVINSITYPVWHFKGIRSSRSSWSAADYNVIEGIGSTGGPLFPLFPVQPEDYWVLYCFSNNNTIPRIYPPVGPYGFDNFKSCTEGISSLPSRLAAVRVIPNPVNERSKLFFPNIPSGSLVIYNQFGQIVFKANIENISEYLIGNKIFIPGFYLYKLSDDTNNIVFSGKFIYQ